MTKREFIEYCLSKPGAAQDYPFGPEPVAFKVGGKVFATAYTKNGVTRFGLKCDPGLSDMTRRQYTAVTLMYKSPYWIYIRQGGDIPDREVKFLTDHSYGLIYKALPKKTREVIRADSAKSPEMTADDAVMIIKLLEQNGIEVYVDGGWGVDALLCEQTRKHEDIDIALPHKYVGKIRELLEERGYRDVPRDDTRDCNFVLGDDKGRLVDIHTYTFDENGANIFGVAYEPRHLTGSGKINGYPVKCPPPDVMVEFHTGYAVDADDYRDTKALCERFNIPLPKDYENFGAATT
jgi:lincosamide nucleotidyltransferase A/C/D/E